MMEPEISKPFTSPTPNPEHGIDGDSKPPGVVRRWLRGWRFILTFFVAFWVAALPMFGIRLVFVICGLDPDKSVAFDVLHWIYLFTGFPLAIRALLHHFDIHVIR